METNVVKISLWGRTAGYISWDKSDWRAETSVFEFDPSFLQSGWDISPLCLSIRNPRSMNLLPWRGGRKNDGFRGLPPVFADSLPDHWGNSIFREWLRSNKISIRKVSPVDMLSFIGKRAMGALIYEPAMIKDESEAFDVDVQKLYGFAKEVLSQRESVAFENERDLLWEDLVKLGTSPGGKRPKALIALNPDTGEVKSGQADVPEGFEHYLLKYDPESGFPFARTEYAYYLMAISTGIEMESCALREFSGYTHFLTRRFDRIGNQRIHMQTLEAMTGGAAQYEQAFEVIRRLGMPYKDREQMFLRMAFNVLAANIDDHSKNFAFLMMPDGKWSLSPAYDLTYAVDPDLLGLLGGQSMSVAGKKENITRRDLVSLAESADVHDPDQLIERVMDSVSRFSQYAKEAGIADVHAAGMQKELNERYRIFVS